MFTLFALADVATVPVRIAYRTGVRCQTVVAVSPLLTDFLSVYSFFLSLDPSYSSQEEKKNFRFFLGDDDDPERRALLPAKANVISGSATEFEPDRPRSTFCDTRRVNFSTGNRWKTRWKIFLLSPNLPLQQSAHRTFVCGSSHYSVATFRDVFVFCVWTPRFARDRDFDSSGCHIELLSTRGEAMMWLHFSSSCQNPESEMR